MSFERLPDRLQVDLQAAELTGIIEGDILTVTINNPAKRNSVTADGYHGLKRAAMIVADEPQLQFLVITGTDDVFCAGGDLGAMTTPDRQWDSFTDVHDTTPFDVFARIPKLVVCAINGMALGGGLVFSLYADLVVASDRARFRVPDVTRGVFEAFIAARLPGRVGSLRANHLIYGNDWLDVHEAHAMGLVGKVVPHENLMSETTALLDRVRKTGPIARAQMKRAMAAQIPSIDKVGMWESTGTPEQAEAYLAFQERRDPVWPVAETRAAFIATHRRQWMVPPS